MKNWQPENVYETVPELWIVQVYFAAPPGATVMLLGLKLLLTGTVFRLSAEWVDGAKAPALLPVVAPDAKTNGELPIANKTANEATTLTVKATDFMF